MPWEFAKVAMEQNLQKALNAAKHRKYVAMDETGQGSETHYNIFESHVTGRNINDKAYGPSN